MITPMRKNLLAAFLSILCLFSIAIPSQAALVLVGGEDLNQSGPNGPIVPVSQVPPGVAMVAPAGPKPRLYPETPHYAERPITQVRPHARRTYFQEHPKVRAALIGAGVGAGAGALTGLVTHRGIFRGAAIGAGAGAGIGLLRSSETMKRHPIVNDVATGTVAGLGLGLAGGRRHGTAVKAAGIGAALGLGVGLFKHLK